MSTLLTITQHARFKFYLSEIVQRQRPQKALIFASSYLIPLNVNLLSGRQSIWRNVLFDKTIRPKYKKLFPQFAMKLIKTSEMFESRLDAIPAVLFDTA